MEFLKLTYNATGDAYTVTDEDGNTVLFTRVTGTRPQLMVFPPTSVTVPGSNQTTATLSWEKATVDGIEGGPADPDAGTGRRRGELRKRQR